MPANSDAMIGLSGSGHVLCMQIDFSVYSLPITHTDIFAHTGRAGMSRLVLAVRWVRKSGFFWSYQHGSHVLFLSPHSGHSPPPHTHTLLKGFLFLKNQQLTYQYNGTSVRQFKKTFRKSPPVIQKKQNVSHTFHIFYRGSSIYIS